MQRLHAIIQELERADLSLERNVALYKEGRSLVSSCNEILKRARHEITFVEEGEGDTAAPSSGEDTTGLS